MGRGAFTAEQGYGIEAMLLSCRGILSVETSEINGGILVIYESGSRESDFRNTILSRIDDLDFHNLPKGEIQDEHKIRELDSTFFHKLSALLLRRYAMRLLAPAPVRIAFTLWRAYGYWKKGLVALFYGKLNVDVLDATAISASLLQRDFGTASSVMSLLQISELLEDYTRKKAQQALSQSLTLNINKVWLASDDGDIFVPLSKVRVGDFVRVYTGHIIPLDGDVSEGEAVVNEASMTGEPLGVVRSPGHSVYAGTVVEEGNLTIRVRTLADNTRIANILDMIDHSESRKANMQSRAEKLADSIVPFSFFGAIAALLVTRSTAKALSVLMVDYSCAIKLACPICIITAMKEAASERILVKGGKFLETYGASDTIVFDKTGTLTVACPQVAKVIPFEGYSRNEVLRLSACLEEHFPHSVAKAIVRKADEEGLEHRENHATVEYVVAHGISSDISGKRVLIGSHHFIFEDEGIALTPEIRTIIEREGESFSVVYLSVGGVAAGMICIEDPVREEARDVLDNLRSLGVEHFIMLTGDGDAAAKVACEALGITEYHAAMSPEGKAEFINNLKNSGKQVIMVGDGINDSPALSQADVSVAMKDGSDMAKEVADITLLSGHLEGLVELRRLSQALFNRINLNYRFILGFNTSLLLLGLGGAITAPTSALLHNLSTMALSGASMRSYNRLGQDRATLSLNK